MTAPTPRPVSRKTRRAESQAKVLTLRALVPKSGRWTPARERLVRALVQKAAELPERDVARTLRKVQTDGLVGRVPRATNEAAIERAFLRADAERAELVRRPDMLTGDQVATRLGLSRATVANRRREGRMLALDLGTKRGLRYPQWQCALVASSSTRDAFEGALRALGSTGAWSAYRFFTQPSPALGGRSPLTALRAGETAGAKSAAATWATGEQGGG